MATRTTLNVSLTPELNEFIATRVASGNYLSASEVVREGLRLLQYAERSRELELEDIRRKITPALKSLDAGLGVDGDEVFAKLEARLDALDPHQ